MILVFTGTTEAFGEWLDIGRGQIGGMLLIHARDSALSGSARCRNLYGEEG